MIWQPLPLLILLAPSNFTQVRAAHHKHHPRHTHTTHTPHTTHTIHDHSRIHKHAGPKYVPFDELRNSKYFVDKTLFIRDFLSGSGVVSLLRQTRRGFGKTTNLDMIRRYAEIDVFPNGTMKSDKKTHKNYKTFADIVPSTGEHLAVFELKYIFEKHFGQHPVIWLDLDPKGVKTYDEIGLMRQLLNGTIRSAFQDHAYLLESPYIMPKDKELLKRYLLPYSFANDDFIRAYPPRTGIILLKRLLQEHFQRAPVVLVDNVDAPLQEVIFDPEQNTDDAFEKLYTLGGIVDAVLSSAFDTSARAEPPRRTLMVGALEPYHLSHFNSSRSKFLGFDGLPEATMKTLVEAGTTDRQLDLMSKWYCGYWEICNLYSVLSYLNYDTRTFAPHWTELGSLESFKLAFVAECFGEEMMECFRSCELPIGWKFSFGAPMLPEDVKRLKELQSLTLPIPSSACTRNELDPFFEVLHRLGYLTITGLTHRPREEWTDPAQFLTFKIPNWEVQDYISKLLLEALVTETPVNGDFSFRVRLFEAIVGVNGAESAMRCFADSLVTLLVASEHGRRAANETLAHSVRVHLLNPPPQFRVKYIKTGLSEDELDDHKIQPDFDLVFVIEAERDLAFVVKIEVGGEEEPSERTLTSDYLDALEEDEVKNFTLDATKVYANLNCGIEVCTLTYLFNDTNIEREKQLEVIKELVAVKARGRWAKF